MDELFLATEHGKIPIDENMQKKYNLKKGTKSPFTDNMIVDQNGDATPEQKHEKPELQLNDENNQDSQLFSVSEKIDIAQGADSNQLS